MNDMRSFDQLDAEVLGVSVDSTWSHKAYAEKMGITYSLLADFQPRGAMADTYGVYLSDKGITSRAIVIINKEGKVAWVQNYESRPSPRFEGKFPQRYNRSKAKPLQPLSLYGAFVSAGGGGPDAGLAPPAAKLRTNSTSCQRFSSLSRDLNAGIGRRPSPIR